ncbi:MAG: bifunctional phosphoserine phosphatase/homoserine phosphotransferase ThrH [Spirochaetales bacterium]|nr:bifunctional phosphoserine phosphatase/homoserine phosphotransferase ThrH [Spirochaetales bacterium]
MKLVCLDLEGVLVPEIWIAVAERTGIEELKLTTRDISDYSELMNRRLGVLDREGIRLPEIQDVIRSLSPLEGAMEFVNTLRQETQLVILSDTFSQFASPLMEKLAWPTLFCNELIVEENGRISGFQLRQQDGKKKAVAAFHAMGMHVFAAGDSYNDVTMLQEADKGMFFKAPQSIRDEFPALGGAETHPELLEGIRKFIA